MRTIGLDFDGTLLDSRERHRIVLDECLKVFDVWIDTGDLLEYKAEGHSNKEYLKSKNVPEELIQKICTRWNNLIETEEYLKLDVLYPDALQFLLMAKGKGDNLILITSRMERGNLTNQIKNLGIHNLLDRVEVVMPGADASNRKKAIMLENKVNLFIGGTEIDLLAAKQAGIPFMALRSGFRNASFWNKIGIKTYGTLTEIAKEIYSND